MKPGAEVAAVATHEAAHAAGFWTLLGTPSDLSIVGEVNGRLGSCRPRGLDCPDDQAAVDDFLERYALVTLAGPAVERQAGWPARPGRENDDVEKAVRATWMMSGDARVGALGRLQSRLLILLEDPRFNRAHVAVMAELANRRELDHREVRAILERVAPAPVMRSRRGRSES